MKNQLLETYISFVSDNMGRVAANAILVKSNLIRSFEYINCREQ